MEEIKLYVSTKGSDNNNGSKNAPFATPEKAIEAVTALRKEKEAKITVYFEAGEYTTKGLVLPSEISGTKDAIVEFIGDGNAIFNCGKILDTSKFKPVSGNEAERLYPEARKNVYVCNLSDFGIAKDTIGPLYELGGSCAGAYDDNRSGDNAEVFCNGNRMCWARYPNKGFAKFVKVIDEGEIKEDKRNPNGGTVEIDDDMNARAKTWKKVNDIWLNGYPKFDWASTSTPIEWFNTDEKQMKMLYISHYGLSDGAEYYLCNIFEELDNEGECYIDRENNLLYVYYEGNIKDAEIMISLVKAPVMSMNNVKNIRFEGIVFEGSRGKGVILENGENVIFEKCVVKNVLNWGLYANGTNIKVLDCEITGTGSGAMSITGGDRTNLIPSGNLVENCYVHDWSQVRLTYGAAIEMCGCGGRVAHNEITRGPHLCIYYGGNDILIEYNYLHEVVQQSNDIGSIYGGRDWTYYGNIIRYNRIENVGNERYTPVGIYWDDTLAGQTAYGNIIRNAQGLGMLIGGGRDNKVYNNLILGGSGFNILFDCRGRDWSDGWLDPKNKNGCYAVLKSTPIYDGIWHERFPMLEKVHADEDRTEDEYHFSMPSRAVVKNNVMVYNAKWDGFCGIYGSFINTYAFKFGTIKNNIVLHDEKEVLKNDDFELKDEILEQLDGFERIPVEKIGRYK